MNGSTFVLKAKDCQIGQLSFKDILFQQDNTLNVKNTDKLKVKGCRKLFHANNK